MTNKTNTVCIIIPCFDGGETLAATIESALAQREVATEIVVIDDGSSDGSLAVARGFEPRIRALAGPRRGASAARNRGIAETSSEWLVFLDADDLLLPQTLSARLAVASATGADVVFSDWQEFDAQGAGRVRSVDGDALAADPEIACATQVWATTAALLYRRALVERIGGFRDDLPIIQDARFLFDAACRGARFAHSPHVGAMYRLRPDSLSRRDPAAFWRDVLRNGQQIAALWQARGPLSTPQREALRAIFDNAGRGLLAAGDPGYFAAVTQQHRLGLKLSRHARVAAPMVRALGLGATHRLLRSLGR